MDIELGQSNVNVWVARMGALLIPLNLNLNEVATYWGETTYN